MPNPPRHALLKVEIGSNRDPGWREVKASNAQTYSYLYTGGDDCAGGMTVKIGSGVATLNVGSASERRYHFTGCNFSGPGRSQMKWSGSTYAITILDKATAVADVKYTIVVTDTGNADCTIDCDPAIKNIDPNRQ